MVANGSDVATGVLPGHPSVVVSKPEGKPGKDGKGWLGAENLFLPPVVSGRENRQANDLQGETMRGEASCPWGDSPGAGAISRGRRRSAQKYLGAISALSRTRLFGGLWLLVCAAGSQSETGRVSTPRAQRHLGARYRYQQVSWVVESGCTAGAPRIDCPFGSGEGGM